MRAIPGSPGTLTSLFLRIMQCVFAAGSIASMSTTSNFFNFTAFCYLIASMGLQVVWSFALAILDGIALVKKKVLHNPVLVSLYVVGDWVNHFSNLQTLLIFFTANENSTFIKFYTGDRVVVFGCRIFLGRHCRIIFQ